MRALALLLALLLGAFPLPARTAGARAEYIGGTRGDIPAGHPGEIRVTDETYFVYLARHTVVKIPYERINLLEYGQKVDRRYLLAVVSPIFLNARKREHYLTVGFQNDHGKQEALLFRIDKDDVRLALVGLEARTGRQVDFQDEESRVAGKG